MPDPDPIPITPVTATITTSAYAVPDSQPVIPLRVQHRSWRPLSLTLWGVIIVAGLLLEGIGIARPDDAWPPLTHVIVAYAPEGATMAFIAWLASHFTAAYIFDSESLPVPGDPPPTVGWVSAEGDRRPR